MLQAGCQRRGDGHHRICGLQLRPPHLASWLYRLEKAGDPRAAIARGIVGIDDAGAEQIGQMLNPAFANRLLAAAEEPPTAQ